MFLTCGSSLCSIAHSSHDMSSLLCCLVMPSKATLFNCKCEAIYDFGTGHRNLANFNPQGNNILTINYWGRGGEKGEEEMREQLECRKDC